MAEYCVVFVDSDGWTYKEMEAISEDLEHAKREAELRRSQSGLPVLGVAERSTHKLVWRTDGQSVDIPRKFEVSVTD